MWLQRIALIFGTVFVFVGVLGWVPAVNPGGKLLGVFDVNAVVVNTRLSREASAAGRS